MCTHLQRRGNRYYIRRRIPLDLIATYGRIEISRALGTSDYVEAKVRCRAAAVTLDSEFSAVRTGSPPELVHKVVSAPIAPTPALAPAAPEVAPQAVPEPPKGISLDELADKWEAERKPDWKSITSTRRAIRRFEALVGKLTAPQITRDHAVLFKDKLLESGQTGVNTSASRRRCVRGWDGDRASCSLPTAAAFSGGPPRGKARARRGREPHE